MGIYYLYDVLGMYVKNNTLKTMKSFRISHRHRKSRRLLLKRNLCYKMLILKIGSGQFIFIELESRREQMMIEPVWRIEADYNQADKKNILQINTETKYRFISIGINSGKRQQQTYLAVIWSSQLQWFLWRP